MNRESRGNDSRSLLIVDWEPEPYAQVLGNEFDVLTARSPEAVQALFSGRKPFRPEELREALDLAQKACTNATTAKRKDDLA
jgi:hypothetical protein